jgi:hypothetical protein
MIWSITGGNTMFQLLNTIPFLTPEGKSIRAEKGSIVRVSKQGRIVLVKVVRTKRGGEKVTSNKERPTTTMLEDIKGLIHTPSSSEEE